MSLGRSFRTSMSRPKVKYGASGRSSLRAVCISLSALSMISICVFIASNNHSSGRRDSASVVLLLSGPPPLSLSFGVSDFITAVFLARVAAVAERHVVVVYVSLERACVFWLCRICLALLAKGHRTARPAERLGMWRGLTRARCLPRWLDEAAAAGRGR